MVYFIFEALYCRFFFFFHFNEALIALHLEITFVLLSSSFSPFLLLIIRFFLSPVIVTPKRYYLLFLRSSTDYFSFLFAFDYFFFLIVSGMDATIPVVYFRRSKFCVLAFFPPLSLPFFFRSFILFDLAKPDYSPSSRDRYRDSDVDTRADEFLIERVPHPN